MSTKVCLHCGSAYTKPENRSVRHWAGSKYCSLVCFRTNRGGWRTGLPVSESTRAKMRQARINNPTTTWFPAEKHPNWKGGVTSLNGRIRSSVEYKRWRRAVLERDAYTCQGCGTEGAELNADHIKPFFAIREQNNIRSYEDAKACAEFWDVSNGRTLCVPCHEETPTYRTKALHYV